MRSGIVTVMRDVTDLRRADQEVRANLGKLREAEEIVRQERDRLNLVIENVGDPIVGAIVLEDTAKGKLGRTEVATRLLEGDPSDRIVAATAEGGYDILKNPPRAIDVVGEMTLDVELRR